jgi:hypothetical protein
MDPFCATNIMLGYSGTIVAKNLFQDPFMNLISQLFHINTTPCIYNFHRRSLQN